MASLSAVSTGLTQALDILAQRRALAEHLGQHTDAERAEQREEGELEDGGNAASDEVGVEHADGSEGGQQLRGRPADTEHDGQQAAAAGVDPGEHLVAPQAADDLQEQAKHPEGGQAADEAAAQQPQPLVNGRLKQGRFYQRQSAELHAVPRPLPQTGGVRDRPGQGRLD
jgi:hypothetical protein